MTWSKQGTLTSKPSTHFENQNPNNNSATLEFSPYSLWYHRNWLQKYTGSCLNFIPRVIKFKLFRKETYFKLTLQSSGRGVVRVGDGKTDSHPQPPNYYFSPPILNCMLQISHFCSTLQDFSKWEQLGKLKIPAGYLLCTPDAIWETEDSKCLTAELQKPTRWGKYWEV